MNTRTRVSLHIAILLAGVISFILFKVVFNGIIFATGISVSTADLLSLFIMIAMVLIPLCGSFSVVILLTKILDRKLQKTLNKE